ncbi:hypothetical protein [Vreelandella neptunia]|uniref:hypothetical protein n=1 Tax=Vreelandella neptunia TaxID=115551 RepID=UPI00315A157D
MSDEPIAWRRLIVAAVIEAEYGVTPTDLSTATLIEVVTREAAGIYEGDTVERERVRQGFGAFEETNTAPRTSRQIRVPYSGSGTKGTPPSYSLLLRCCAMSETIDETLDEEKVIYDSVSEAMESISLLWWSDGELQVMPGVRGTWTRSSDVKAYPYIQFDVMGLYQRPTTAPAIEGVLAPQAKEVPVNKMNSQFVMDSFLARMQTCSFDVGNTVVHRHLVNYEGIHITDRRASGQLTIEAPRIDKYNIFPKIESHQAIELSEISFIHGTVPGNIVEMVFPRAQLSGLQESDTDGIKHYQKNMRLLPNGNDDGDFQLIFR